MSIGDITLNSEVYTPISVSGTTVVRKVLAPATNVASNQRLEISHRVGKGNKPGSHLVKFSVDITNATTGLVYPMSVHAVFSNLENAGSTYFTGAGNILTDNLCDLLTASTYGNIPLILAGGFL